MPASPWAFSSFGPGENEIGPARTFDPSEAEAAQRFINELQGKRNIYYSVNRVSRKLGKKAAKADIEEIHYLHVDADLNKALDWSDPDAVEAEKASVLAQLRSYDPRPQRSSGQAVASKPFGGYPRSSSSTVTRN